MGKCLKLVPNFGYFVTPLGTGWLGHKNMVEITVIFTYQ